MASIPQTNEKAKTTPPKSAGANLDAGASYTEVVFEEFLHYAAIQRRFENNLSEPESPEEQGNWMSRLSKHKGPNVNVDIRNADNPNLSESDREQINSLRALTWASVFYLVTTDVFGPFDAPYVFSQVGWVSGVLVYFFMGLIALYTGTIMWRLFMRLDSLKYPLKNYPDIAERIFGRTAGRVVAILQTVQLIINVATICLTNGQAVTQISKDGLCFTVCIVIWALVGMVIGQIRTLKNYGLLANIAVWINLLIIFITMGVVAHIPPNFESASDSLGVTLGPITTAAFVKLPLYHRISGVVNIVYAYGGVIIFPEIMAEMRRPKDFWKGMTMAQALIFTAYLLFGTFVYAFQGQFTLPRAYMGVSNYTWQTVVNALSLITGIIAAGLYGNIGIKLLYTITVKDWFKGPPLMSRKGRYIWSIIAVNYWALAFVIGSAIPQVQAVTVLIAAISITQCSYTFPFFLRVGYDVITDAMAADEPYAPGKGARGRVDSWNQWSRWRRGLFSGRCYFKLLNCLLGLGALAMSGFGIWGAIESIKRVFAHSNAAPSFGCRPPV